MKKSMFARFIGGVSILALAGFMFPGLQAGAIGFGAFGVTDTPDTYEYTHTIGAGETDVAKGITMDKSGNIYTVGRFGGTVDFNPSASTDEHVAVGGLDVYLTKRNADGSYGYTYTLGGAGYLDGTDVAVDSNGNIYIVGGFNLTADFDPTASTDEHTAYGYDAFLTKINADGSYGYTYTFGDSGSTETDLIEAIVIDSSDNIHVIGSFYGTIDFDPSAGEEILVANGPSDIFYLKISSDESLTSANLITGSSENKGRCIALDKYNNIYLGGHFMGTADFDPSASTDEHTTVGLGTTDTFVTKIKSDGSYGYTYTFGGDGITGMQDMVLDQYKNIYISGQFTGTTDFNPTTGEDTYSSYVTCDPGCDADAYVTKMNANGTYGFTYVYGGPVKMDIASGMALDTANNLYITGVYGGTTDFDPSDNSDSQTSDPWGVNLTKLKADGSYGYTHSISGDSNILSHDLYIDSANNIYIVGEYFSTVDFDPTAETDSRTSNGGSDIFFTKYSPVPVEILDDTVVKGSGPTVYYVKDGKKKAFSSANIFKTWSNFDYVLGVSDASLGEYESATKMGFRDGTLIKTATSPVVYVIENGQKRAFTSGTIFKDLGYRFDMVMTVTAGERDLHTSGPKIESSDTLLDDTLVKGSGFTIYYIEDGKKRAFTSGTVFKTWGSFSKVNVVPDSKLTGLTSGPQMGFRSGFLIKGTSPTVYVIEDDLRRAFSSGTVFRELGYSFSNVMTVSDTDLTKNTPGTKIQ
ncbi:SBBP repeat-containing protein [Patescibacteria group bacterium]